MSPPRHDTRAAGEDADTDHDAPTDQPAHNAPIHPARAPTDQPAEERPTEGTQPGITPPKATRSSGASGRITAQLWRTTSGEGRARMAPRPPRSPDHPAGDPARLGPTPRGGRWTRRDRPPWPGNSPAGRGNPRTTWCVTVTDQEGHATGHGCARTTRRTAERRGPGPSKPGPGSTPGPGNTPEPNRPGPKSTPGPGNTSGPGNTPGANGSGQLAFTRDQGHGPPGGYGRWRLYPGGDRDLIVDLEPLAVNDCDHRHESAGYQPSDPLRHLVQIRDAECTWPPCGQAARRCDFEHAIPWDQGGRTCSCNGGPRWRHHHHAKQAHGWKLEQNQPGYHTWTTPPAGRSYTTGPAEYPI